MTNEFKTFLPAGQLYEIHASILLFRDSFVCLVFWKENVLNIKSFRHTTQSLFILGLHFRLCSGLSCEQYLVVAKHQARIVFQNILRLSTMLCNGKRMTERIKYISSQHFYISKL